MDAWIDEVSKVSSVAVAVAVSVKRCDVDRYDYRVYDQRFSCRHRRWMSEDVRNMEVDS